MCSPSAKLLCRREPLSSPPFRTSSGGHRRVAIVARIAGGVGAVVLPIVAAPVRPAPVVGIAIAVSVGATIAATATIIHTALSAPPTFVSPAPSLPVLRQPRGTTT